ncbi:unnamed protein product [Schistosoma turkestanicum]|nr:unnamed protein product [Schistosoma turkestanicum]
MMLTNFNGTYYLKYFLICLIIFSIIIIYHNNFTSLHNLIVISNQIFTKEFQQTYYYHHYYQLPSLRNKHCTYSTCFNIHNCIHELVHKSLHTIRIYVYPIENNSLFTSFSEQFITLYNTILSSKYYVNRIEQACIIVPGLDLLYAYSDDNQMIDLSMRYLHHLPSWNEGKNHLIVNFLSNEKLQNSASAIVASASHTSLTFRPKFDIVLPAFNPFTVVVNQGIYERRTIFLIVFQSTDEKFINQVQYLLLDSRTFNSNSQQTILVLDYSSNQSNTTYNQRFALVSESHYRQSMKKWINYSESLCSSEFCLIIDADNVNRFNLYDSLACGCIPVIVNDEIVLPFSEVIDWYKISIQIPRAKFQKIPSILSTYSLKEKFLLRKQIMFIYQRYFSSIEKIILTTLDILNDRVFPQYSRSYAEWNYPNYSKVGLPISPVLFYPAKSFPRIGFTALVRAHNHFSLLCILLKSIQSVKSLKQVVVVWTNKIYPVPDSALWPTLTVPLSIVRSAYGSVNGRFFPYRQIKTEAVFSIEEDTCLPSVDSIERAFELWCENPERLVSLSDKSIWHLYDDNQSFSASFSSVFFHKHYLHLYTDLLANPIKAFIDNLDTCEDIFFYWFIIQTSDGQSVLNSSQSGNNSTIIDYNSSNLYNFTNECHITPKHCSFYVSQLKAFMKQFDRTNYYPMKISHITAGAL